MNSVKIKDPCINKCNADQCNDKTCTGCYRTEQEIYEWRNCSEQCKIKVLEKALVRRLYAMDSSGCSWYGAGNNKVHIDGSISYEQAKEIVKYFEYLKKSEMVELPEWTEALMPEYQESGDQE